MTQALAVNGYTADTVAAELIRSGRRVQFGYEWLDSRNSTLGWLPNVTPGGTVTHSALSTIKRVTNLTMIGNLDPGFNLQSHRVRPWMHLVMPDGGLASWPQGVFLLDAPTTKWSRGLATVECSGSDQGLVLTDDSCTDRYLAAAGRLYTDVIGELLVGCPDVNIVASPLALPVNRLWDPGTTKLQIINDLSQAINYGSLWFDGFGQAQVLPYTEPDSSPVGYSYVDVAGRSLFTQELSSTLDLSSVPNYIVFSVSQPDRPVLTSVFANTDPSSPVSIPARGRKVVRSDASLDVATQVELDALVKRAAINAANVYQSAAFSTPPMPFHEHRDVLEVVHTGLGLAGKFAETEWKLTLAAGAAMTHTVRRVVNLDAALVGTPDATQ